MTLNRTIGNLIEECLGPGTGLPAETDIKRPKQKAVVDAHLLMSEVRARAFYYLQLERDFEAGKVGGVKSLALANLSSSLGEWVINGFRDEWLRKQDERTAQR